MRFLVASGLALFLISASSGTHADGLVAAARDQVGVTIKYDPSYAGLKFPGGDIPRSRGVCTDVVIRAMRDAWKMDLQALVNEDMKRAFSAYPKNWGLSRPDPNIDHRRVPNLRTWFKRQGWSMKPSDKAAAYQPGDLVTWDLSSNLPHIGIVSDRTTDDGTPLIIHNIGRGTREEDVLFQYSITGHYRRPSPKVSQP